MTGFCGNDLRKGRRHATRAGPAHGKACVIGNLNADLILYPLQDFPAWGTEVIAGSTDWRPGGIGNTLPCLTSLRVEVSAVANVGQDPIGRELLSTLEEAGVNVEHIERLPNVHTSVSVGLGREDGETQFCDPFGTPGASGHRFGPQASRGLERGPMCSHLRLFPLTMPGFRRDQNADRRTACGGQDGAL